MTYNKSLERLEHPLVVWSSAPDNKREEQSPTSQTKLCQAGVAHPRPRYESSVSTLLIFGLLSRSKSLTCGFQTPHAKKK